MPYTTMPKRFSIDMVHCVVVLVSLLPCNGGLHSVISPKELVTGKKFRCPKVQIGQYIQGLVGGTNDTEQERSINALYLGRTDNGRGHTAFKLDVKADDSINRVVVIPTPQTIINRVN